jgi:methylated-DNA-[protein]-cysteine S-methyltransferase
MHATSTVVDSPIGPLALTAAGGRLTGLQLGASPDASRKTGGPAPLTGGADETVLAEAAAQLAAYFAGELTEFDLPLSASGTEFQQRVWRCLRDIPYGQTWSYGRLAAAAGNPKASRAVGMANNRNPIPIVIPCHRVIGADGRLVGYGGGLDRKTWLLDHERTRVAG